VRRHRATTGRLLRAAAVLAIGALGCRLAFQAIGSRVDANGVLREPFWLLPTSALLLLASAAALTGALALHATARHR